LFLLDQDGPAPDDAERARRRGVNKGPQQPDGNTRLTAELTPAAWAIWEALFAKFAAPGMCNPADQQPTTSGTPTQAQIDTDSRTIAQRRHDALAFIGRAALDKAELGQHNGLATTIIVRTTLQDLESRAGVGVSGGGTILPLTDVLQLAAHANTGHYLAVFDGATGSALNLFRAKRTASVAQRIALIARDGGCTKPGCTVPAYGTQAHHAARDWTDGGLTNVDDLAL
ncbi:HNH endonuclease, partial [Mycolicibacterium sp. P9-64]|uniref:HNH endonuclease signature motif containing protein n=1 Tax=Mycolicibacterium sp. P9-64 TaxID=2024612 RepID=UPI0011F05C2B